MVDYRTKEYRSWCNMKTRCLNPNFSGASRYSVRGISICSQWIDSFSSFLSDVGYAPSPSHSLDRIDNDGNYEPDNVRWATREQQNRNRAKDFKPQYKSKSGVNGVTYRNARKRWRVRVNNEVIQIERHFSDMDTAICFRLALMEINA